ncbi:MAG: type II toxin-antitoxin system RelE/ParE family toxin [Gemmataceae bacterium]|nr:type II toxin-antitoxin system RelE/ParE family toxin [Gemmataceae bacterium]
MLISQLSENTGLLQQFSGIKPATLICSRFVASDTNFGYHIARMSFEIILAPEAVQDLKALRAADRAAVKEGLEKHLRNEPMKTSRSRIKRLRGMSRPQYRLRVDEYRVFYDVTEDTVEILAIVAKYEANNWLENQGEKSEESSAE